MADITTNLSGTTELDNSAVLAYGKNFIISATQADVVDQFASVKEEINAKSISFRSYANLSPATTALNEREEVTSSAMSDSEVTLTPSEYGAVVTTTALSSLQSGGAIDLAAAQVVGINVGRTRNVLASRVLETSANVLTPGGVAEASLPDTAVMTVTELNRMYNKLRRANIPGLPQAGGMYVAFMHDDVVHDLRNSTGAGSWQDVVKYTNPDNVLRHEIGMIGGFRIVTNNDMLLSADAGLNAVDTYRSAFIGFNALGKAVSLREQMVMTGPFDKLARFVNVGWKGVFKYGLIDTNACWISVTASSIGSNS